MSAPRVHWQGRTDAAAPLLVCAHGWGQSHTAFFPLVAGFASSHRLALLDLPGFGDAPAPPSHWGVEDYAAACAAFLDTLPSAPPVTWVGHSYGGRIGLVLAAKRPDLIARLVLIAAAGLPTPRPWHRQLRNWVQVRCFKLAKFWVQALGGDVERLRARFGSADYRNAGALRPVLVRSIAQDLTGFARRVRCPTLLLYGADDRDTPPALGQKLQALISGSALYILPGFDHHTVLTEGRHQVTARVQEFFRGTP